MHHKPSQNLPVKIEAWYFLLFLFHRFLAIRYYFIAQSTLATRQQALKLKRLRIIQFNNETPAMKAGPYKPKSNT